jgi:hypothetical protein
MLCQLQGVAVGAQRALSFRARCLPSKDDPAAKVDTVWCTPGPLRGGVC